MNQKPYMAYNLKIFISPESIIR